MDNKQILFKISMGRIGKAVTIPDNHEYIIYTNGEIEGFLVGAVVVNYFPSLLVEGQLQALALKVSKAMKRAR